MFKDLRNGKIKEQEALVNLAIAENRALSVDEQAKIDGLEVEINNLENSIKLENKTKGRIEEMSQVQDIVISAEPKNHKSLKVFNNFAEQLNAVRNQAVSGIVDERLIKLQNASGMNTGVPDEGGFAVQTDFAGLMMETAVTTGNILPLVDRYEIGGSSNGVKWVDIDETSVATTVYGGVQSYWAAEAGTVTATKPKLIEKKLDLEKLMGVSYATYELDQDSTFVSQLMSNAFTTAIQRELENTIINGNGAGKPLGFLNGASTVSVAKESGQVAATVVYENIVKMYNRALNKTNSLWLVHPDVQEQLDFLAFPVGVGRLCPCA